MRLLYSAGSPFARLVRIALLETGLDARVTKHEVTRARLYSPESDVLALNPVGRVPTLELDDGTILTENKLILDYIDALNPGPKLLPRDGSDGWRTLAEMGQALGLLEGIVTWIRALVPPEPQRAAAAIARGRAGQPSGGRAGGRDCPRRLCPAAECGADRSGHSAEVGGAATARMEMAGETTRPLSLV